jgi:serine protease Do
VGINSQIYTRSGGYQGVSFAIPIELATRVQQQIQATGKAQHAKLGVSVQEVNQAFADSFKLDKPEGALVASVEKNGPAAKAGLEPGDVVRKVDGKPVVGSGDLPAFIGQALPGQKVTLEVWRKGESKTLSATLGDASDKAVKVAKSSPDGDKGKLGLALRPCSLRRKSRLVWTPACWWLRPAVRLQQQASAREMCCCPSMAHLPEISMRCGPQSPKRTRPWPC